MSPGNHQQTSLRNSIKPSEFISVRRKKLTASQLNQCANTKSAHEEADRLARKRGNIAELAVLVAIAAIAIVWLGT